MREWHDALVKDLLTASLEDVGRVERGVEVSAATQRMDLWFTPDAEHRAERERRGLLGRMVEEAMGTNLEPFRNTPSAAEVRVALRRAWAHHQTRELAEDKALPLARTWVISPGHAESACAVFGAVNIAPWPAGVYVAHKDLGLGVVVLSQLPRTRDTLALRLMARDQTLAGAVEDLLALEAGAWERRFQEILVRWRCEALADLSDPTDDEVMFMQPTFKAYYDEIAKTRNEGRSEGRLATLERQYTRRLGRPFTDAEGVTFHARFAAFGADRLGDVVLDCNGAQLAAWLADPAAT